MRTALFTILLVMPLHLFAAVCSVQDLCALNITSVPDRISKGRLIRGGSSANLQNCEANCELQDVKHMEDLIEEARARLRKIVLAGRAEDDLAPEEKKMREAFLKPKRVKTSESFLCSQACLNGGLAFALRPNDDLCVCPMAEKLPDEFMIFILGHEIAHAGNICGSRKQGFKPGEHPFEHVEDGSSVLQCLEDNGIQGLPSDAPKDPQVSGHCKPMTPSKMFEASADVLGFQVLADFLKDHPFERDEPANLWRSFSLLIDRSCRKSSTLKEWSPHPPEIDRVEKIAMAIPALREALSCREPTQLKSCQFKPAAGKAPGQPVDKPAP